MILQESRKYNLAKKIAKKLHPEIHVGGFGKTWQQHEDFLKHVAPFEHDPDSLERKFQMYQLLKMVKPLNGVTIELGAYKGSSSYTICSIMCRNHYMVDSFKGLKQPTTVGKEYKYWKAGDLYSFKEELENNLKQFKNIIYIVKGWIPEVLDNEELINKNFCFANIDVDLYHSTFYSLKYCYERMVKNGIILIDDYGFKQCLGARIAVNTFMENKLEPIIEFTTGQAFIVKKG